METPCDESIGVLPASLKQEEDDFDEAEFPEGRPIWRLHRAKERRPEVVKLAKARARRQGRLYCWACGFDFALFYGPYGEDFIEAHHTTPVHQLTRDSPPTKVIDLAMVCANCHRILHRHPELTIKKLQRIIA